MSIYGKPFLTGVKTGTASGPIVSVNDALAAPLRSLLVNIDPVQDLHGYDSPWPAGGGKNKGRLASEITESTRTQNGCTSTPSEDKSKVRITGTATNGTYFLTTGQTFENEVKDGKFLPAGTYTLSTNLPHTSGADARVYITGHYVDGTSISGAVSGNAYAGNPVTFTIAQDIYYNIQASCPAGYSFGNGMDVWFQIESGSTVTAYAPYSNSCPISGWTECNVWRKGKNLANIPNYTNTSSLTIRNESSDVFHSLKIPENTRITCSADVTSSETDHYFGMRFIYSDGTNSYKWLLSNGTSYASVTSDDGKTVSAIAFAYDTAFNVTMKNFQLELSSTPTPYEPYSGNQYTIQLGQTVYGATLDVTNGVPTVDRAIVDMSDLAWTKGISSGGFAYFYAQPSPAKAANANFISSCYKTVDANRNSIQNGEMGVYNQNSSGYKQFAVRNDAYADSTETEFATAMSGQKIVYPLATPITIPLTPQEISTLQGQNNVWADTGDVDVEYLKRSLTYIS